MNKDLSAITFTVYGKPAPQGSMRAFQHKTTGRVVNVPDNARTVPWKQEIGHVALSLNVKMFPREVPIELTMNFYFSRPKSAKKRKGMTVRPDGDKLQRACADAITGILIEDDAQIVEWHARKHYGGPERCEITVQEAVWASVSPGTSGGGSLFMRCRQLSSGEN